MCVRNKKWVFSSGFFLYFKNYSRGLLDPNAHGVVMAPSCNNSNNNNSSSNSSSSSSSVHRSLLMLALERRHRRATDFLLREGADLLWRAEGEEEVSGRSDIPLK